MNSPGTRIVPPRYFALHALQPDCYGGGTLSVMSVQRLSELLSEAIKTSLTRPEYLIRTLRIHGD